MDSRWEEKRKSKTIPRQLPENTQNLRPVFLSSLPLHLCLEAPSYHAEMC
jgi:hypothetical protein